MDSPEKASARAMALERQLREARAEIERLRQMERVHREFTEQARRDNAAHHVCPTAEQVRDAYRSRDQAFAALAEVAERHAPRDDKFCRCGRTSLACEDQRLVSHYPALRTWLRNQRSA